MKIKYLVAIIVMAGLTSCSDSFLDQQDPNQVTTASFWKTEADLYSGLATVYSAFTADYSGYYGTVNWELKDARTENFTQRNDVRDRYEISVYQNTASNDCSTSLYTGAYIGIFRANQVIQYGSAMDLADDVKNKYIAEAKFLRGLNYFNLVNDFGAVPIHTKVPQSSEDYYIAKSTIEEVWQQVISDFTEAAKYLPATYSSDQKGRATKGAALAFLGRAYLYRGDYANAQTVLKSIVDNESTYGYGLQANYAELFDGNHENGPEGVLEIQYSTLGGTAIWANDPASKTRATFVAEECAPGEVGGWYEFFPTQVLLNKFLKEPAANGGFDPRATTTIAWDYPGCKYYQLDFHEYWPGEIWLRKNQNWWNEDEGNWKSTLNEYGMRYADVLLMLAEAYTMQNNVSAAAPLVHRIRQRATLTNKLTALTAYSKDQMMEEIRHQRDLEFAREGLHFYDLRRWGLLEKTIKESQIIGYQNYSSKFEYYPIPESELDNNPNMKQSDAWK